MCANDEYILTYNGYFFVLSFEYGNVMTMYKQTIDAVFFCHPHPIKIKGKWNNLTCSKSYKIKLIGGNE